MAVTCSVLCRCGCLAVDVSAHYERGGVNYDPCDCQDTLPAVCCPDNTGGLPYLMKYGGHMKMTGALHESGTVCYCMYTGSFELCEDGDLQHAAGKKTFAATVWVFDTGLIFSEIVGDGLTFRGQHRISLGTGNCIIVCYEKDFDPEHPLDPPVYNPVYGPLSHQHILNMRVPIPINATATNAFQLSFTLNTDPDSLACRRNCEVSYVMRKDSDGILLARRSQGRCPSVRMPEWDDALHPGRQCLEEAGTKDCHGNPRSDTVEYVIRKDQLFPPADLPCELDCSDLFIEGQASNQNCSETFPDADAWWRPYSDGQSIWYPNPRIPCAQAAANGYVVWKLTLGPSFCEDWYVVLPPEIEDPAGSGMFRPRTATDVKNSVTMELATPCGIDCTFYEVEGCINGGDPEVKPLTWLPDPIPPMLLVAKPLQPVIGCVILEGPPVIYNCLGLKAKKMRQHTDVVPGDPPMSYDLCQLEQYDAVAAQCMSPLAPDVTVTLYPCPNCSPGCYENDFVTPLPGFSPSRYYPEVHYGATREAAVNAAMARGAELAGMSFGTAEGTSSDANAIVPFSDVNAGYSSYDTEQSYGNGCCSRAWPQPRPIGESSSYTVYQKWVDSGHVSVCEYGIEYLSTRLVDPLVPLGPWQSTIIMCCQCRGETYCCKLCTSHGRAWFDMGYNDFYRAGGSGTSGYTFKQSVPVLDELGIPQYCRDMPTGQEVVDAYRAYRDEMYGKECWAWMNGVTADPWQFVSTNTGAGEGCRGGWPPNLDCTRSSTYHDLIDKKGETYTMYVDPITFDNWERKCTQLVCQNMNPNPLLMDYRWFGVERVCRTCHTNCETTTSGGSCEANPCLEGYQGPCHINLYWSSLQWLPVDAECTEANEQHCMEWLSNRHNYTDINGSWAHSALCNSTLMPTNADAGASGFTCGIHTCAEKCGFKLSYEPGINPQEMYTYCSCYGSSYYYGDNIASVSMAIGMYNQAVGNCLTPSAYNPYIPDGMIACDSGCGESCQNSTVSTNSGDYVLTYSRYDYDPETWSEYWQVSAKSPWTNRYKRPMNSYCWTEWYHYWDGSTWQLYQYTNCEGNAGDFFCCAWPWWPERLKSYCT